MKELTMQHSLAEAEPTNQSKQAGVAAFGGQISIVVWHGSGSASSHLCDLAPLALVQTKQDKKGPATLSSVRALVSVQKAAPSHCCQTQRIQVSSEMKNLAKITKTTR